jgi:hypothetical protein
MNLRRIRKRAGPILAGAIAAALCVAGCADHAVPPAAPPALVERR